MTPTAGNITVRQVLEKFEGDFASVAAAVGNAEYCLWVGSGISRQAPDLGNLIRKALEFLRVRATEPATATEYLPALQKAIKLADHNPTALAHQFGQPFASWGEQKKIVEKLWNSYSKLLDIRIPGESDDFILWDAVDIRQAFAAAAPPAAAHLCIAVLAIEGFVKHIASANWDTFIEAAGKQLGGDDSNIVHAIVDPSQLRENPGKADLLKYHGCIGLATADPAAYRQYLTGSENQLLTWSRNKLFSGIRHAVVGLAVARKTLVLGLSIQDGNLKDLFAEAVNLQPWPWPSAPNAPAFVFCEDEISDGQTSVLRLAFQDAYAAHSDNIHSEALLRAYGEQVLVALVLKLLTDKLTLYIDFTCQAIERPAFAAHLIGPLKALRDQIADLAVVSATLPASGRTDYVNQALKIWSKALAVFRTGGLPADLQRYEALSSSTLGQVNADANERASGLGSFAIGASLMHQGQTDGRWLLSEPANDELASGVMVVTPQHDGATARPVFFVKSMTEALKLHMKGAHVTGDSVVIHGDSVWVDHDMTNTVARTPARAPGRTGKRVETHVSLERLLATSADVVTLSQSFQSQVLL